jgi:penicillin-binding protein 1A
MAGKTGTPQNWSDAWTVGFSAYYTTAIWFGFDKPGNSLGVNLTGSTLAGPVWADYMREIHQGLAYKDFARPASGVIDGTVCTKSGLLITSACNEGEVTLPFLEGTQPSQYCNVHGNAASTTTHLDYMRSNTLGLSSNDFLDSLTMPVLDLSSLPQAPAPQPITNSRTPVRNTTTPQRTTTNRTTTGTTGNRLLDGDDIPYQEQENTVQEVPGWDARDTGLADYTTESSRFPSEAEDEEDVEELPFYNFLFE